MNILHVVNTYFVIPYFLGDQLSYFKNKGYNIFIICSPSELLEACSKKQGFKYYELPILRKICIWKDIKAIIAICRYIKAQKIDLVCGHTPKGALVAMIASFIMRIPERIYFRHGLVYETTSGIFRLILKTVERLTALLATKVICVSPSLYKKSISDKLNPESKQLILHNGTCNGIDIDIFKSENICDKEKKELYKTYQINPDDFIIGYVGRLVKDKGITQLVEAFLSLCEERDDISLLLVGMYEERDALSGKIKNIIDNHPRIIITGYIYENIRNFYSLMDVFVLPSFREGFNTSILEASSMSIPVLTTRVTGCIDAIIDKETGLFISHEPESIKKGILLYLQDDNMRKIHGKNGRKFVTENFVNKEVWNDIEKLYR